MRRRAVYAPLPHVQLSLLMSSARNKHDASARRQRRQEQPRQEVRPVVVDTQVRILAISRERQPHDP